MKARIQIPAGWRRVPAADIRKGDRWLSTLGGFCWAKYQPEHGQTAYRGCTVIRRLKRMAKAQKLKYIELTLEQWDDHRFPADSDEWLYQSKEGGELLTWSEWMARRDLGNDNTRFWLRRGAK